MILHTASTEQTERLGEYIGACLGKGDVVAFQGTVEYFVDAVFNYPTLAECYKVAALNGLNKIRGM